MKNFEAYFADMPFFFHSAKTAFVHCDVQKKLNSTKWGAFFDIFASRGDTTAHARKTVSFCIFFQELSSKKKIKYLRLKMTK